MTPPKILVIFLFLFTGCSPKQEAVLEPLPEIEYHTAQVTPFLPKEAWTHDAQDWTLVSESLRFQIQQPEALETKLDRNDREIWKTMLQHLEQSQQDRREALILSNLQITPAVACEPPSSAFSLQQRAQLQLTLQLHRNVLWRIGRLEMSSRGIQNAVRSFLSMFSGGRIKDADQNVVAPVMQMMSQIEEMRSNQPVPKGDWKPGQLHYRAARTTHPESVYVTARTFITAWSERMKASERWNYLGNSADPVINALQEWMNEFDELVKAYRSLAAAVQQLEHDFAPPHALVAWPCINQNLKRLRIISDLYSHILPIQWALSKTQDGAYQTLHRLNSPSYASINHDYLANQVEQFIARLEIQKTKLVRSEDLLLVAWDETNEKIWNGLPDFIDPIHHHSRPAVENAETWRLLYQEIKTELSELSKTTQPEPEQPLRHGKPLQAYISSVLETLHAPSRIDEGEKGLLAISELEAHMVSIRDELLKLCKQGACQSFPEAELANSPRKSAWIVTWRQNPTDERTLGHTLIVIKLCQLHLNRLIQRLTEIYAWFSETTNADLSWEKLKSWQRIWTLYSEPNGTYASFLKSVANLDQNITSMGQEQKQRAESETLHSMLSLQDRFFDLTLDYARFIDSRMPAPVSFDELISTWEQLDSRFVEIEKETLKRDFALHPEWNKEKHKVVDIPR